MDPILTHAHKTICQALQRGTQMDPRSAGSFTTPIGSHWTAPEQILLLLMVGWYVLVSKIPQFSVLTPQLSLASLSIQYYYINYYNYNLSKKHLSIEVINRWFHVTRGRISIPQRSAASFNFSIHFHSWCWSKGHTWGAIDSESSFQTCGKSRS